MILHPVIDQCGRIDVIAHDRGYVGKQLVQQPEIVQPRSTLIATRFMLAPPLCGYGSSGPRFPGLRPCSFLSHGLTLGFDTSVPFGLGILSNQLALQFISALQFNSAAQLWNVASSLTARREVTVHTLMQNHSIPRQISRRALEIVFRKNVAST